MKPRTLNIIVITLTILLVVLFIKLGNAQTPSSQSQIQPPDSSPSYDLKEEVIVESSRPTQVKNATVIAPSTDIRNKVDELPTYLSTTPSVTMYSDNGTGIGYMYYRLRGLDQTRINITLDNIPMNEPEDQGLYFSNFTDIHSSMATVEINRGAGVTTNGTSNYAGSINFESKNVLNKVPTMGFDYSLGSFNTKKVSIDGTFSSGNAGTYFKYTNVGTDGYRNNSGGYYESLFIIYGLTTESSIHKFTMFGGNSRSDMAYVATAEEDLKLDRKMNYLSPQEKDNFKQKVFIYNYYTQISNKHSFQFAPFFNTLTGNYDVKIDNEFWNFNLNSKFYGLVSNYTYNNSWFKSIIGLNANNYSRTHFMYIRPTSDNYVYNNTGNKYEVSTYFKPSLNSNNFQVYGDVQLRHVNFKYSPDKDYTNLNIPDNVWTFINYNYGLNITFDENFSTYGSVANTNREPTRNDMFAGYDDIDSVNYAELGGINNVKPEAVTDYELGIKYDSTPFSISINYFYMKFKNEITPIGKLSYIGLPLRKNVKSSVRYGLETDARYALIWSQIQGGTSITYMKANINNYVDDNTGLGYNNITPLLTPSIIINQSIGLVFEHVNIGLDYKYQSWAYLDNIENHKLPAYSLVNAHAGINFAPYEIQFIVNNVFNKNVYTSGYSDGTSRYFYVAPKTNFIVTFKVRV